MMLSLKSWYIRLIYRIKLYLFPDKGNEKKNDGLMFKIPKYDIFEIKKNIANLYGVAIAMNVKKKKKVYSHECL